jgi:hypothetical protein
MAALTIQTVGEDGNGNVTFANSAASDTVAMPATVGTRHAGFELQPLLAVVTNGDSGTHVVTVGSQAAVSVLAGDTAVIPIYSQGIGDTSVTIVSDVVTSQTVAIVRLTGS